MAVNGVSLSPIYLDLAVSPQNVRSSEVLIGPMNGVNLGSLIYLQFHITNPIAGSVPFFAFALPASSAFIIDAAHLGGGMRVPFCVMAVSSTMGSYTAAATTGSIQIMVN